MGDTSDTSYGDSKQTDDSRNQSDSTPAGDSWQRDQSQDDRDDNVQGRMVDEWGEDIEQGTPS